MSIFWSGSSPLGKICRGQHKVITAAAPLCRCSEVKQKPPCSTNRSVTKLFRKNMPPILKPGTRYQKLLAHQSPMRPFVLSLSSRDERRQKTERKSRMLPLLPVIQGFDFASLCVIAGQRSTWREGRRKKEKGEKKETEQCGHARCLLVYLSSPSTLQQLTQQREDSFPLNQGCGKIFKYTHTSQTGTHNRCMQKDHFTSSCFL